MESQQPNTTPESVDSSGSLDTASANVVKPRKNTFVLLSVLGALVLSASAALVSFLQKQEHSVSIAIRRPEIPGWLVFTLHRDHSSVQEIVGEDLPESKEA